MSILIKGMEMPKGDPKEPTAVWIYPNGYVRVFAERGNNVYSAEAVPLPEGHGKIIDGDALWENMTVEQSEAFQKGLAGTIELFEMLEAATPIVSAEGDGVE